jgi:hypothetical protein
MKTAVERTKQLTPDYECDYGKEKVFIFKQIEYHLLQLTFLISVKGRK